MSDMNINNNISDKADKNDKNGKNRKLFKGLSAFKRFLIIYASVLVLIIAVALLLLHSFLKDYEAGRPANTMDNLITHIEKQDVGEWVKKSGLLGEFETEQMVSDYFRDTFNGKEAGYKKKAGEYSESSPVYVLYAGDDKIASVSLTESRKNAHKFTEWKISSIDFNVNSKDKSHSVKISVPKGSSVELNGVKVSSDYITGEDSVELCKHVGEYVDTPANDVYEINGLFTEPQVKVYSGDRELKTELAKDGYVAYYPEDNGLLDEERTHILTIAEDYGKYMINRGSLTTLSSYMIGTAKEYMSDIPAIDVYLIGRTFTYNMSDENISNFRKYSDDCYSCDVDYKLNVNWSSGDITYDIALTYIFVKQDGAWMLADFKIR